VNDAFACRAIQVTDRFDEFNFGLFEIFRHDGQTRLFDRRART